MDQIPRKDKESIEEVLKAALGVMQGEKKSYACFDDMKPGEHVSAILSSMCGKRVSIRVECYEVESDVRWGQDDFRELGN